MSVILDWLSHKWQRPPPPNLSEDYRAAFATPAGRRVLQHWMDQVYCSIYEGKDVQELWMHNGRRAFVQEILEAIDLAEQPQKYGVTTEKETPWITGPVPYQIP